MIMHSINNLRQTLGLTSANQVRNRIEAIRDLLYAHIRRGPNNQILLTDAGAELLRRMQELHDSGLTMTEASEVLRAKLYKQRTRETSVSQPLAPNVAKPDQGDSAIAALREELGSLRRRVAYLERRIQSLAESPREPPPWWSALQEEIDVP